MTENGASFPTPNPLGERTGLGVKSIQVIQLTGVWPRSEEPGLEATDYYSPLRSTFANGMHAAIVETDPETADIKILRYCVVHDCGPLINPRIVAGQVHGGVAQGVGGALYERLVYDEHGQLLNASYMDFLIRPP